MNTGACFILLNCFGQNFKHDTKTQILGVLNFFWIFICYCIALVQSDNKPKDFIRLAAQQGWILFGVPGIVYLNHSMNKDFQDLLIKKT